MKRRYGWVPKDHGLEPDDDRIYCENCKDTSKHKKIDLTELDRSRCSSCGRFL